LCNTTCPHLFLKIFVNFLTSMLLCAQNTTLLSKVQRRFFSNFVAFSENPNFPIGLTSARIEMICMNKKHLYSNYIQTYFSYVLGSSSIRTCQILNIRGCFLQAGLVEKIKTNIQNSTHPDWWPTKNFSKKVPNLGDFNSCWF